MEVLVAPCVPGSSSASDESCCHSRIAVAVKGGLHWITDTAQGNQERKAGSPEHRKYSPNVETKVVNAVRENEEKCFKSRRRVKFLILAYFCQTALSQNCPSCTWAVPLWQEFVSWKEEYLLIIWGKNTWGWSKFNIFGSKIHLG